MVIGARVCARLLGLQILTLDARVVVAKGEDYQPVMPPLPLSFGAPGGAPSRSSRLMSPRSGFARAIELFQQSTDTLERSRRWC
jgi:hypothetical protein